MVSQFRVVLALAAAMAMVVLARAAPPTGGDQGDRAAVQDPNLGGARAHAGTAQASARLMKELMESYKSDSYKNGVFQVELVNDNLYEWDVKLLFPNPEHALHKDLKRLRKQGKRDYVLLRITFPEHYPNELPFVRIVYPIMRDRPSGALCMHLLSPQGWLPDCTVEALILTVMDHMVNYKQRVELVQDKSEYSEEKSEEDRWTYIGLHGWNKPKPKDQAWYEGPDTRYSR